MGTGGPGDTGSSQPEGRREKEEKSSRQGRGIGSTGREEYAGAGGGRRGPASSLIPILLVVIVIAVIAFFVIQRRDEAQQGSGKPTPGVPTAVVSSPAASPTGD